jgi:large subunit ribosomal protein L23Ae
MPAKTAAPVSKAASTAKTLKKTPSAVTRKVRHNVHFFRPKTRVTAKKPEFPRKSTAKLNKMDDFRVVVAPLTTETAMKKIEDQNTLVFLCDVKATKQQIKDAVTKRYDLKVAKVNTLIRPDGQKKAFIRLHKDQDALDVANRIGLI